MLLSSLWFNDAMCCCRLWLMFVVAVDVVGCCSLLVFVYMLLHAAVCDRVLWKQVIVGVAVLVLLRSFLLWLCDAG